MLPCDKSDPLQTTDLPWAIDDPAARTTDFAPAKTSQAIPAQLPNVESLGASGGTSLQPTTRPSVPGYEILDVLGRGGMGVVYKARHVALRRIVALKMVLTGGHAGPQELARFRTEAEAVARIQHPNIVQIHEVGEAGGHPYFALEFVEGGTLAGKLAGNSLPFQETAALVETLARAVQAAHTRRVIHRDLKPANVLLAGDGTPKITDFGLARHLDADTRETQTGVIVGTPAYMAPEQAGGLREVGPSADVYALGAILYECLTGKPPFSGVSVAEMLVLVRTAEPVPPSRVRAKVPRDLETICLKAMAKESSRRYATAGDLAEDLRRYLADEPILARRASTPERLWRLVRQNLVVTGLSIAVLVLAVIAGVFATRPRSDQGTPQAAVDDSADDLLKVVAELDRIDPGWRLDEIQHKRPDIPAEVNGATQIERFRTIHAKLTGRPKSEGTWWHPELADRIYAASQLAPTAPLTTDDAKAFSEELVRVNSLVGIARRMIDYPRGRFATIHSHDVVSTLLPDHQAGRSVALLLDIDAKLQLIAGNQHQALNDCRAMWNVGRIYLDEPMTIAQLIRIKVLDLALRTLERILAQGECTDADLAEFQGLINEANQVSVHVTALRGERGASHYFLSSLASGDLPAQGILDMLGKKDRSELPAAKDIRRFHAWILVYTTETIGIANQPPERWTALLESHNQKLKSAPLADHRLVQMFTTDIFSTTTVKPSQASGFAAKVLQHLAELRTALTALAVERHRRTHGAWPKALGDLVGTYIAEVPGDPYDGRAIRYRRTEDGVVVYSVGPDKVDDHGALHRREERGVGKDVGFRLRDADRRQAPNTDGR